MWWAIGSLVGFAVATGLVIWLGRSSTARWERDRRASRAAVPPPDPRSARARAAALLAEHVPDGVRRLPHPHVRHPHLPHLLHIHLPSWVVDRLPRGRPAVHLPHVTAHLPHLDGRTVRRLVHLPVRRSGNDPAPEADEAPPGP